MNRRCWLLALGGCLVALACGDEPQRSQPPEIRRRVVAAPVSEKSVPLQLKYVGNMKALQSAAIQARVTGYVIAYHFREGEDVEEGQLLFTVDPRPFEAALLEAQAKLAADQAELAYALEQVVRYAGLADDEFLSRDAYDRFRTSAKTKQADVQADRAAIALAELNLEYTQIRAPFSGRAGQRLVDPGNLVTAGAKSGDPTLVVINQIDPIKVIFAVPEQDLPRIRESQSLTLEVVVPGHSARTFAGEVWLLDNQVDTATGMIAMEGMLLNPGRLLWPGQFVKVRVGIATLPSSLFIPSAAISIGQVGPSVFTVTPESKVELRPIQTGVVVGDKTEVLKGVKAGERVVVEGRIGLQSGIQVEVNP